MPISVSCSACNVRLTLGDDRAGDRFECPNCDAIIKVPGPSQPTSRAAAAVIPIAAPVTPAPRSTRAPEPEDLPEDLPEDEPQPGMNKAVLGGIIAGVAALLLVGVAVVVFAVRKPAEVAKQDEPSTATAPPATAPPANPPDKPGPGGPAKGGPNDTLGKAPTGKQPSGGPEPKTGPQPPPTRLPSAEQFNASFLGSQGKGRRFCIIADNSGSMGGAKLANLKTQLVKTLTDLHADGEFYVCFFNTVAEPMPHPTWVKAGSPEAERMKTWVKGIASRGGTQPAPGFDVAFKLDPPPDLIFFMTDGGFSPLVAKKVVDLNGTPRKAVVNTIMFGNGPPPKAPPAVVPKAGAEGLLRQIAEQNGGTFTYYTP